MIKIELELRIYSLFRYIVYTAPAFAENATCTVESIDADSATVSWPAPSTARFYYIDVGPERLFNSTSNVYSVTGLSPIINYTFTVTVYGNAGSEGNDVECHGKTGLYSQLTSLTSTFHYLRFWTTFQVICIDFPGAQSVCDSELFY